MGTLFVNVQEQHQQKKSEGHAKTLLCSSLLDKTVLCRALTLHCLNNEGSNAHRAVDLPASVVNLFNLPIGVSAVG